jgi:uncharacterized protein
MIIIHDVNSLTPPHDRLIQSVLDDHLRAMPAVVLTGARQTGKSTLAAKLTAGHRTYRTLDDFDVLRAAQVAPEELLDLAGPLTLDEVQRAPDLLLAIKRAIDVERVAGRFLLTGSANLLLMHRVAESLAGRATYLTLWPMTRREQLGTGRGGRWDALFATPDAEWKALLADEPSAADDWRTVARRGGFPTVALHLSAEMDRTRWFEGYIQTYLERDLRTLSNITALPDFRRLMRIAALRVGQLINQTEIGRDSAIAQPTAHRYLNLLETSYMLVRVPAFAVNRTKRLIKTPKLYWGDVGLAVHLAGAGEPTGAHLENIVLHDLLAWRETLPRRADVMYWRTASGAEVDFVVELNGTVLPIEVKATNRPRISDADHLRTFLSDYGDQSRAGLLLHTGDAVEWIAPNVLAAPWWRVL